MLWPIFLAAITAFIIWALFLRDEDNPLDQVPGPPKWPIIGNVIELLRMKPDAMFSMIMKYNKLYGERYVIKVLNLRVMHTTNPTDIETILSHSKNITKSKPYTFLEPWLGSGLLVSTGGLWHRRRKILTPTFHFNILKNFSHVFDDKCRALVHQLKQTDGAEVDLLPVISDFTLSTVCETAMGTKLDDEKSASTVEYKTAIGEIGYLMLSRLTKIWAHNDFLFNMSPMGKQFTKSLSKVQTFADNVIMERKKQITQQSKEEITAALEGVGTKNRLAMLDLLLEAENKGEIDLGGIRDEVYTFMFEGHDTTALGLTFGLMLLADHEEVQERVYEECQQIFGDSNRTPTMSDFADMKYLEAVIKETLRLYPSVPFIGRKITEDLIMGDITVKKDSEVSVLIYNLHHREDLYPDPEAFKPERFLEGEVRHPYAYLPFSAGPRNCIGQRFAMQEMKCALSEVCRNFRLLPRTKGARPELCSDMVLRPKEPIYVKFVPR